MTYTLRSTKAFQKWFNKIRDKRTKDQLLSRLDRLANGSFGDYKQLSPDLFELRFFFAGGLRIYFTIQNTLIIFLLVGGDKSSQSRDIEKAQRMLDEME